ncbi:Glutamate receptor ionotropic, kainate 4 [Portunus trituberculatus]|uniref:Glutamate receptor ionotropic, kainate 4 n=1 Tax=Portunus trituberculatus TaxID=210409 RepID=A0A5B7HVX4_PORTR|nr:Glutamate receptor ionotropic, kainate 4 [Portunus trituberculatus]
MGITSSIYIFYIQFILASDSAAISAGRSYGKQLVMLSEVVSGPALGRPLALHFDAILPADLKWAVLSVKSVQQTPHLTLTLGLNQSREWQPQQEAAEEVHSHVLSSSSLLHVVLWLTPRAEILRELWAHWKPRNLLLFSLGSSLATDVLRDEALSGVNKLALIGHLSAEVKGDPDAFGVYTMLPFSSTGVQLLGPWSRDSFSSWEALFRDRFSSFEGYIFQIAPYVDYPPFIYRPFVEESKFPSKKYGRGVAVQVFEAISKKLNYSYTITEMVGKWGAIENGSWVGILGTMARKEKNFTISGFYINEERLSGFDPSVTVGRESSSVFVPSPKPLPEWLSIVRPFSPTAWASFMVVVVISVFSMATMVSDTDGIILVKSYRI